MYNTHAYAKRNIRRVIGLHLEHGINVHANTPLRTVNTHQLAVNSRLSTVNCRQFATAPGRQRAVDKLPVGSRRAAPSDAKVQPRARLRLETSRGFHPSPSQDGGRPRT